MLAIWNEFVRFVSDSAPAFVPATVWWSISFRYQPTRYLYVA
jgi:hypothetical protein